MTPKKFQSIAAAAFFTLLSLTQIAAAAGPGIEALPLTNTIVVLYNPKVTYDRDVSGRIIALQAETPTSGRIVNNYFRSILMNQGWKSVGTVSTLGLTMVKGTQRLLINTHINEASDRVATTVVTFQLSDDADTGPVQLEDQPSPMGLPPQ
jgi:hypothetical protein